jgi:hypothetical protein
MKKIIEKAKQYESKKSLDGKMKFLKGNVGKVQAKKAEKSRVGMGRKVSKV